MSTFKEVKDEGIEMMSNEEKVVTYTNSIPILFYWLLTLSLHF
jgi:hypothetical protein